MNCYDCGEALEKNEGIFFPTDEGLIPCCATCGDFRKWENQVPQENSDVSDGDIFDHYRFPT